MVSLADHKCEIAVEIDNSQKVTEHAPEYIEGQLVFLGVTEHAPEK